MLEVSQYLGAPPPSRRSSMSPLFKECVQGRRTALALVLSALGVLGCGPEGNTSVGQGCNLTSEDFWSGTDEVAIKGSNDPYSSCNNAVAKVVYEPAECDRFTGECEYTDPRNSCTLEQLADSVFVSCHRGPGDLIYAPSCPNPAKTSYNIVNTCTEIIADEKAEGALLDPLGNADPTSTCTYSFGGFADLNPMSLDRARCALNPTGSTVVLDKEGTKEHCSGTTQIASLEERGIFGCDPSVIVPQLSLDCEGSTNDGYGSIGFHSCEDFNKKLSTPGSIISGIFNDPDSTWTCTACDF